MFLEHTLVGSGIAAVVMVATAAIAGQRAPSAGTRSAMQHLAAGVICAVVAAELVPAAIETGRTVDLSAGFVAGFVLMLSVKAIAERLMGGRSRAGLLVATGLDVTIDGLLIGVAFAIGTATGGLFVLAFTVEFAAVGLAIGVDAGVDGARSLLRSAGTAAILVAPVVPAAVAGQVLLSPMSASFEAGLMGFAISVCLYLVIEELMREAHAVEEHPVANWLFFAGFLGLMLLQMQIAD